MIINDFYVVGVTAPESKTDPPAAAYRNGPLPGAIAGQLVEPNASQCAQVVEAFRHIQRRQATQCQVA